MNWLEYAVISFLKLQMVLLTRRSRISKRQAPSPYALNGLGLCYRKNNEHDKSICFLKQAIEVKNESGFRNNLAMCLSEIGDKTDHPRLLIGSVFASDDDFQEQLLDLQLRFIKATTDSFDHVVFISKSTKEKSFENKTHVIQRGVSENCDNQHVEGLESLHRYFLQVRDQYDYFLILDSDAFPIKKNWIKTLTNKMSPQQCFDDEGFFTFSYGPEFEIASVIRQENFESRLHASILFANNRSLDEISFEYRLVGKDILNRDETDVCLPLYQFEKREKAYPLIRTNKVNIHPIVAGVYGDMFYHHGAGTRSNLVFRGGIYHDYCTANSAEFYMDELFKCPSEFISNLAGWDTENYAVI